MAFLSQTAVCCGCKLVLELWGGWVSHWGLASVCCGRRERFLLSLAGDGGNERGESLPRIPCELTQSEQLAQGEFHDSFVDDPSSLPAAKQVLHGSPLAALRVWSR